MAAPDRYRAAASIKRAAFAGDVSSAERASDDPTPHEALVLSVIGADPVTAADLVELTGLSIQGVRKHLRALIAAGRVSRDDGAGHRSTTYTRR